MIESDSHAGFTTEVSADWETIPVLYDNVIRRVRAEFPRAHDLTMLGGHSSHSYINGTNMYFVYNYAINCAPEDEMRVYHHPIQRIIVEETLKAGGSMCHHHGIGKYRNEWTDGRARLGLLHAREAQGGVRSQRDHELRHHLLPGRRRPVPEVTLSRAAAPAAASPMRPAVAARASSGSSAAPASPG